MATPRTRTRREATKRRLEESLLNQLGSSSFRDLRVEDIAEPAGLSRSAFYFYYAGKHALLMDAAGGVADALFEHADRWWHGEGEPAELVREALTGVVGLWSENRELLATAFEVSTYDAEMGRFWRGLVARFVTATAEQIRREQEAGRADPELDPQGTSELLNWGMERILYVLSTDPDRDPAEIVEVATRLWVRAIYRPSDA